MLEFRLFGPLSILDDKGRDCRPKLMKSRAILAVLAATPGHRHSRSWFQNLLWPDRQHEQGLSSLRSALADIRRHLGPDAGALSADYSDVALDPAAFTVDLDPLTGVPTGSRAQFLEGFDIAGADGFEDWLREMRMVSENPDSSAAATAKAHMPVATHSGIARLYLGAPADAAGSVTRMHCDALVDCLARSTEELSLAETIDGRGFGRSMADIQEAASVAGCGMILLSEAAEGAGGAIIRLKVIDTDHMRLIWSKSLTGQATIDLEDPVTIGAVAEFLDMLSDRLLRSFDWHDDDLPPRLLAAAGVNYMFRLGAQNFDTAENLLRRAHAQEPSGRYLAWRAFLRTFLLGEFEFGCRDALVEEGTALAHRALEAEPHNSVVLALCAHVENMLHDDYQSAFDLAARALELNRCNPMAWASLGSAAAFLGKAEDGFKISQVGAKLAAGSAYGYQLDGWASAAGVIAGQYQAARVHAERSHKKSPIYAPPLRLLSALYCHDGLYDKARQTADKLRKREPGFALETLKDTGYPAESIRMGGLLASVPTRKI